MSRTLYVDTGAVIALLYQRDEAHERVSSYFRKLRAAGDRLITYEPVIAETATRLRYDAGLPRVAAFRSLVERAVDQGSLNVRESEPRLPSAAFEIMQRFGDLRLSYADAVGAVIAEQRGVDAVFGLNNDFRVTGFALEP